MLSARRMEVWKANAGSDREKDRRDMEKDRKARHAGFFFAL
jgi:hypothetical protein